MCPTCRARFRSTRTCPRCGTDLTLLMRLQLQAWRLREAARQALLSGDRQTAARAATASQRLHRTPHGAALLEAARG